MKRNIHTLLMLGAAGIVSAASGQNIPQARITVDVAREEAEIAPTMYGIFFEDINRSADGGMYAELIFNRGFEEKNLPSGCTYNPEDKRVYAPYRAVYSSPEQMRSWSIPWDIEDTHPGWTIEAADGASYSVRIDDTDHLQVEGSKAMYLSIDACREPFRLVNSGFYGLAVEAGEKYDLRFYVRAADGYRGSVTAEILAADGEVLAAKRFALKDNGAWSYFEGELKPSRTVNDGRFALRFDSEGSLEIDYVSLFPRHTFHNRPNGLRRDVAQFVADLKPAFMRWPGGCIVEGLTMENRVNWKNTIGKPELRKGEYNLWGYHSTNGFGYHEFLQFCEDIGADGMFVCNAGMSCLFRNGDYVQGEALDELIQEALDAIEYALGDARTTRWGAERAKNGHPEPFPLKYVEVGNENVFARYAANYNRFHKAIKERYPQLTVISALMFSKDIDRLDQVEMIDPHYYETPDWFYNNARVYDKLSRRTPYKVYVGEYAAVGRADLYASLAEAAYLTGVERNSDKVQLVSYAPLIANAHYGTNHLIVLDNAQSYGRSNYHVMKLFSENRPDVNIPFRITGEKESEPLAPEGCIGLSTGNTAVQFRELKVTSRGRTLYETDWSDLDDRWEQIRGTWRAEEGTLTQPAASGDALLVLRGLQAGDCTISLKARKLSGTEGFRVVFGFRDERHYFMADMGSHTNESVLFREIGDNGSVSLFDYRNQEPVEANHWYDVRIEIRGSRWKCFLDGELKYAYDHRIVNRHYAAVGLDRETDELVVKLVNARTEPWQTSLALEGGRAAAPTARRITLTSEAFTDENSFEAPERIAGKESELPVPAGEFPVTCPPRSLTILRIPVAH